MSMSMSMSCSPSPSSPQHHAALDLLDDCWFFSNTLASNKPPSTSTTTTTRETIMSSKQGSGSGSVLGARKFLRTPSLPAPRRHVVVEEEEEEEEEVVVVDQDEEEVDDDDLNWSSIYQGVLRTRMAAERGSRSSAALQRAPSMPVVPSSSSSKSTPSMPKLRHSNSTTLARSRHQQTFQQPSSTGAIAKHQQQQQHRGSTSTSKKSGGFQDKKWKSSSDLESIEVQGFRDLGFVFDKEELRDSLGDVLPGLKQQQLEQPRRQRHHQMQSPSSGGSAVPRPYLSEAWQHVQPRPAPVRVQSSSPEMKDQLRMWAQAVACNVRHEC